MSTLDGVQSGASGAADGSPPNATPPRRRWGVLLGVGAAVLVIGGVIGGVIAAASSSSNTTAGACDVTSVAPKVLPSVVTITATSGTVGGTGSGEVIRSDGSIMTNNHVISLAAGPGGQVSVLFANGSEAPATITGRDPKADLAVIKVNGQPKLPVIALGTSNDLVVGTPVVALGAPLGLSNTVTSGIISALNRTVEVPSDNGQTALLANAIQTDASINPGNSGGALVDCAGKLVGVPSAGATAPSTGPSQSTGSIGLGFAIPVDLAQRITDEIIATGTSTHSYFGLVVEPIPPSAAAEMGTPEGLYVVAVVPGGPSAAAGLQPGDIVTEIDGKPATAPNALESVTLTKAPGEKATITYVRGGKTATTTVTLGSQP
jgi:putative serine protease PepD